MKKDPAETKFIFTDISGKLCFPTANNIAKVPTIFILPKKKRRNKKEAFSDMKSKKEPEGYNILFTFHSGRIH